MIALDLTLDLPPLGRPRNHAQACAALDARRDSALRAAAATANLAETMVARGDYASAGDLATEARRYLAEVDAIDARRVK